jgi:YVTN family beta-propeller protein
MVTSTISVGSGPVAIAITPNGSQAYVVNSGDNTVSAIKTSTNTVTSTIPVGMFPGAIAITPEVQPPIPITPEVQPPTACPNIPGAVAKQVVLLNDTDHYIVLRWCPSITINVIKYLIFRDGEQIGSVPSSGPLKFKDHNLKKGKTYVFNIVSVDSFGKQSAPLSFTIKAK